MLSRHRLLVCRQPESGSDRSEAARLADLLAAWPAIFDTAPHWRARIDRDVLPLNDKAAIAGAMDRAKVKWQLGSEVREAIDLAVYSDLGARPLVELKLTGGISPLPLPGPPSPAMASALASPWASPSV